MIDGTLMKFETTSTLVITSQHIRDVFTFKMGDLEWCRFSRHALEHDLVQFIQYIIERPSKKWGFGFYHAGVPGRLAKLKVAIIDSL